MKYFVEVIEDGTNEVVERLGPQTSRRMAEKLEDGVGINLNWDRFSTQIVEED